MERPVFFAGILACCLLLAGGCVQRVVTVKTDPPGALVYLNGQEIGRTPVTREFLWYGDYAVTLRLEGYETLKTDGPVAPPWWQWIPLDLLTDMLPVTDHHELSYSLKPLEVEPASAVLARGEQARGMLTGSDRTKYRPTEVAKPTTAPANKN